MQDFWQQTTSVLWSLLGRTSVIDLLDILIVAFLVYKLLSLTRDTRASQVLKGIVVLLLVYWLSDLIGLRAVTWILQLIISSGPVVIVVLFQTEIRRALEQIGRVSSTRLERIRNGEVGVNSDKTIIDELVTAMTNLARRRVGALVVIEQRTGLNDVIATGTRLDAEISAPLIENIFEPNTPLHDGAMIIRGYRIVAAATILTLSDDSSISRDLGTRHRAALGISETTDAVTLIVSEETGIISLARGGKLTRHMDARTIRQLLEGLYGEEHVSLLSVLLTKRKQKTEPEKK